MEDIKAIINRYEFTKIIIIFNINKTIQFILNSIFFLRPNIRKKLMSGKNTKKYNGEIKSIIGDS